jgi:signal transduction histidine kinase
VQALDRLADDAVPATAPDDAEAPARPDDPALGAHPWRSWLARGNRVFASPDLLVSAAPVLSALRWASVSLAFALALTEHLGGHAALGGSVLVVYTFWRTVRPIGTEAGRWHTTVALLLEVAVGVAVVEATGFTHSPFLISLGVSTLIAGFAGGLSTMSGLAAIAGLAVALPSLLFASRHLEPNNGVQFSIELVLVGVVGGFCRHLLEDTRARRLALSDRVEHLSEVNEILLDLHRATEREVTPMHVEGAARWALERLEEMFETDLAAVVLREPATGSWHVAAATGVRTGTPERPVELIPAIQRATKGSDPVMEADLAHGLSFRSRWGLYCPMRAREELVGVLAVESQQRRAESKDRRRIADLARAAALAIDNARWLERIQTLGMEQERSRLARELHDHIGQSVVYIGFELDRLVQLNHGRAVQADLIALRGDLRDLVEEMRDMLVDLRTDVSETHGVEDVLQSFLDRVNKRNRIVVSMVAEADTRMPLPIEREVWRVAREAVMNAERHAHAAHVSILWLCNADGALLEVADDGVGLPPNKASSGYGLVGMRERADSIGAQLEITSGPGTGTVVRMRVRAA